MTLNPPDSNKKSRQFDQGRVSEQGGEPSEMSSMNSLHPSKRKGDVSPYFNRELSWLAFNDRVLEEARFPKTPTLERLKFLGIYTRNLDEFFMVRVAGKRKAHREDFQFPDSPDHIPAQEVLSSIYDHVNKSVHTLYETYYHQVVPELKQSGIHLHNMHELSEAQKASLTEYFRDSIFPVLTPMAVDPSHPFPYLTNLSLYLLVCLGSLHEETPIPPIAFVEIPSVLPRLVPIKQGTEGKFAYTFLEDLVAEHLGMLFPGFKILQSYAIKVTRNLDYTLLENEVVDLLASVQSEVKNLKLGTEAIRLEVNRSLPPNVVSFLQDKLHLEDKDIYYIPGPIALNGMMSLYNLPLDRLKDPPFNPRIPLALSESRDLFSLAAEQNILLHHPYDSFYSVIELLSTAAQDPSVLAIKQTLYRTSGDSPIIDALIMAAEAGKQVTAVVELKARFDERNNIVWARRMERAGVNVSYGFVGLKTHAKMTLIIRQENQSLKRYVHLSTGNYNSSTARIYEDLGLITADPALADDITILFNVLTGFNVMTGTYRLQEAMQPNFKKIAISPLNMRETLLRMIDEEIAHHRQHHNGLIIAKMNALVDKTLIDRLYEASHAGIKVHLIIRGICCLRPGVKGLSENIEVISILGRFLEHSRIFYFHANGQDRIFLGSADWMPRNMDRRVEILFPIDGKENKNRIKNEILMTLLADNTKARTLDAKGNYTLRKPREGEEPVNAQHKFIKIAREKGVKSLSYEEAIHHDFSKKGRPVAKKDRPKR